MAGLFQSIVLSGVVLGMTANVGLANCSLRYGISEGPVDYDPVSAFTRSDDSLIANHVAHSVLTTQTDGSIVLRGAVELAVDPENQTIRLDLDPSCRWDDGQPVTSHDFEAGLRYALSLSPFAEQATVQKLGDGTLESTDYAIEAPDDTTLIIGYEGSPDALLPYLGTIMLAPIPLHQVSSGAAYYALPLQERVLAGPYTVRDISDNRLDLEVNPFYCETHRPTVTDVVLRSFATDEERMWAFVGDEVDVMRHVPHKQLQSVEERREDVDINYVPMGAPGIIALMFNPGIDGLDNPDVRRAAALAIDYRGFIDRGAENLSLTRGYSDGYIARIGNSRNPYVDPADVVRSDAYRARLMMEELGYSAENPLKFTITTYPLANYESAARQAASMLSRAHFDVTYIPQASVQSAIDTNLNGHYDSFVFGYTLGLYDNSFGVEAFARDQLAPVIRSIEYKSEEVPADISFLQQELDHLLALIAQQQDPEKRLDYINLAEARIGDSGSLVPLYSTTWNLVSRSHVRPAEDGFAVPSGFSAQYWINSNCGE